MRNDPSPELWFDPAGYLWARRHPDAMRMGPSSDGPVNLTLKGSVEISGTGAMMSHHYWYIDSLWSGESYERAQQELERIVQALRGEGIGEV